MRDIFVLTLIVATCLFALKKPQIGILGWLWLSIMNPHRLSYGFIYSMPVLDGLVAFTLVACMVHWKERASVEFHPLLKLLAFFYAWCTLTMIFGVNFSVSVNDWVQFTKTLLLMVCMLLFMNKKHWIIAGVAVFIISVGYTGIKGGLFTIMTGGGHRVWGPPGTAWGDNNGVSLACLMTIPLTLGFAAVFSKKLHRNIVYGSAFLFLATVLGTQSRGGFLGLLAMGGTMVLRSQRKMLALILVPVVLSIGFLTMPQSWHNRMATIQNYEQEGSAQTRLIQWRYAIDIAMERPLFGNGFDAFYHKPYYFKHVAHLDKNRAVHSNYFQVLGEQGFIGLAMFLTLLAGLIVSAKRYAKMCAGRADLAWAASLIGMAQFSLIGYGVNGLTVNMAYLDLYYYVIAFIVLLISQIRNELGLNVARPMGHLATGPHGQSVAPVNSVLGTKL